MSRIGIYSKTKKALLISDKVNPTSCHPPVSSKQGQPSVRVTQVEALHFSRQITALNHDSDDLCGALSWDEGSTTKVRANFFAKDGSSENRQSKASSPHLSLGHAPAIGSVNDKTTYQQG